MAITSSRVETATISPPDSYSGMTLEVSEYTMNQPMESVGHWRDTGMQFRIHPWHIHGLISGPPLIECLVRGTGIDPGNIMHFRGMDWRIISVGIDHYYHQHSVTRIIAQAIPRVERAPRTYRDHPEYRMFIRAICANPADDMPRLVFADWLDEHAGPCEACGEVVIGLLTTGITAEYSRRSSEVQDTPLDIS